MSHLIASSKTGSDKYDDLDNDPLKVLPKLDMRLLGQSLQAALQQTLGYSLSGNEGSPSAIAPDLSGITTANIATYTKDFAKMLQTYISHGNYLDVDAATTANNIVLKPGKITTSNAPDGNNYAEVTSLPFAFKANLTFTFRATLTNTGATQLSIPLLSGLSGAVDVVDEQGGDLVGGEIVAGKFITIRCNSDDTFALILPAASLATTTTQGVSYLPKRITVSNGTDSNHDIDFTAGVFQFDDGSGQAVASALTKQIDSAWSAGDAAGGLDTGSVAADTTYHMFAIYNPTTSTADFLFSTSVDSPTLPSGYTKKYRVASILTDGSSNLFAFLQRGKTFQYTSMVVESSIAIGAYPTTRTSLDLSVPSGIPVEAIFNASISTVTTSAGLRAVYYSSLDATDQTPADGAFSLKVNQGGNENEDNSGQFRLTTNTSGQIGIRGNSADIGSNLNTFGYKDYLLD